MAELIVDRTNSVDIPERAGTNACIPYVWWNRSIFLFYILFLYYLSYLLKVLPPFSSSLFVLSAN